jgi:transposase
MAKAPKPKAVPRPVGRPTKYEPRFCDMLIADMEDGYSATAFAGSIGVSRATLNLWAEAQPEFMEALNVGKSKRLRFWERTGISVAAKGTGGPGAATVITFGLKNMGGDEWRDKQEVEHSGLTINVKRFTPESDAG